MRLVSVILIIPLLLSLAGCAPATVAPAQGGVQPPLGVPDAGASTATPLGLVVPGGPSTEQANPAMPPTVSVGSDFAVAVVVDVTTNQVTRE